MLDLTDVGVYWSPLVDGACVDRTAGASVGADLGPRFTTTGRGAGASEGADWFPLRGVTGTPMFTHFCIESETTVCVRVHVSVVRSGD